LQSKSGSNAGSRKLEWFDRSGKTLGTVGPIGEYRDPELSPDGKRIAVVRRDPQTQNDDIWLIDVANGVPSRWTFDPGIDMYPVWSPTGEQIAFGTSRNGMDGLYLKAADGGVEDLLLKEAAIPRDWSRDKRFLVYGVATATQLMVLPLSGDRKPFPYLPDSKFQTAQSRISPDGKWLVYWSNETGRQEIYVQNFPIPSAKYQISTDGGTMPKWRSDGKEIFYFSSRNKLMGVPVRTTDKSVEVSAPSVLFDLNLGFLPGVSPKYGARQQYDVTADGQRFLVNVPADATTESPMTVVWNWLAAVKH
jgi:eukaryotic-like serine/threonine-protein kinase